MRFVEQVRLGLIELIARDGFVDTEHFTGWSVDNLLANAPPVSAWPERRVVEAVLKDAFEHFVRGDGGGSASTLSRETTKTA
jgi:hypothetical protein